MRKTQARLHSDDSAGAISRLRPTPETEPEWLARLAAQLRQPEARLGSAADTRGQGLPAAVLVAISDDQAGSRQVLLTERAHTLRHHPGQLAFPGGVVEPGDAGPGETALREGYEEVGLDPDDVQVVGLLPASAASLTGFDVTTVVGWWHTPNPVRVADPTEVAQVIVADLDLLLSPAARVSVRHPAGNVGPGFWLPDPQGGSDLLLWGLSAYLLDSVVELAGWTQAWDRLHHTDIPQRFRTDVAGGRPIQISEPPNGPEAA